MISIFLKCAVFILVSAICSPVTSPCGSLHSANGFGDIVPDNLGRSRGVGGAGVANGDGMTLLRDNPALLGSYDCFAFSLEMLYGRITTNASGMDSYTYAKSIPQVMKLILPVTKNVVIGWGLSPYSKTDVTMEIPGIQDTLQFLDTVSLSGGLNVSTFGIAVSFKDRIRIGYTLNYTFGIIEEKWLRTFGDTTGMNASLYDFGRKYKGYGNSVGFLVKVMKGTTIGAGYTGQSDLTMNLYSRSGSYTNPDILLSSRDMRLPENIRFGVCSDFNTRLKILGDLTFVKWEKAARSSVEKEMYNDTWRIGAGVRYIPSTRINARYYKKIPLSLGFSMGTLYYKSYPKKTEISEKSVTLGIELPFKESLGSIMTSFEFGARGDKGKNGWDETFMNVGLSLIGMIR